ncbi:MAG: RidA family protein, partial [Alphaproteobacteria bacterium]|nr:RidA family protein [Alphaproteobacteria bacterium]
MAGTIESRLAELGIDLPRPTAPAANYVPYVIGGGLVFVSGQVTMGDGGLKFRGRLGEDLSVDEGYQAARLCGLNLIAQAREAAGGDLDRIRRVVKLGGFVNCTPGFTDHPKVMNG